MGLARRKAAETRLYFVSPDRIDSVWPRIGPLLERALARGNRYTPEWLKERLRDDRMQLWVIHDDELKAVAITELIPYELGKSCNVFILTGKDVAAWGRHIHELEAWARSEGCKRMEALARPGWSRMARKWIPQMKLTHVQLEWDLNNV